MEKMFWPLRVEQFVTKSLMGLELNKWGSVATDRPRPTSLSLWASTGGATMAETTPGKRLVEITAAMRTGAFNLRDRIKVSG